MPPTPSTKKIKYRTTVEIMVMIAIVAKFINDINLTCSLNLTGSIQTTIHVKITVKPLIKIENIIMKNGRT